jgi:serine/threonine protein kinase/WD40 repeat protein
VGSGTAADALCGTLVAGRYRVAAILGDGGMGVVYAGQDSRLDDRAVAIKVLITSGEVDGDAAARFDREARIMSRLNHPNLVAIHDTGQLDDDRPFIVMELLEGETLAERAARGAIELAELEQLAAQIGRGLDAAHRSGVVHRDLKPHNIFLCGEPGGTPTVKLLDFGISKLVGSMTMRTETTQIVGTPQYMSPEQARGEHELISPRSDVFAFATILYELISGERPFDGQMLHEVVFKIIDHHPPLLSKSDGVPERVAAAIAVGMAKDPRDRFASAGDLVRALTGEAPVELPARTAGERDELPTVRDRPPRPGPTGADDGAPTERDLPAPTRRRRWPWIAVAVAAFVGVGLGLRDRATNGHPHRIGDRLAELRAAIEAGDRGVAAMEVGRDRDGLEALAQAYIAGDRRLSTRIGLRRALVPAAALITRIDLDGEIEDVDLAPGGDELMIRRSGVVTIYDLEGRQLAEIGRDLLGARYSDDGQRIVLADADRMWIIERSDRRELHTISGAAIASGLDGDRFVAASTQPNTPEVTYSGWTIGRDRPDWELVCPPSAASLSARDVTGRRGVFCSLNPRLVDLETGETVAELHGLVIRIAVLPGGERVLAFNGDGAATVVDDRGGVTPLPREPQPISVGAISNDGSLIALASAGSSLEIRAVGDPGMPIVRRFAARGSIHGAVFAPSGHQLAIGDALGTVAVIDAATGWRRLVVTAHTEPVNGLLFSADGRRLLSASRREIRVWDLDALADREVHRGASEGFDVASSGAATAVKTAAGIVVARRDGEQTRALEGIRGDWRLSASGRWLATGPTLVDLDSGRQITLGDDPSDRPALSDDASLVGLLGRSQLAIWRRAETGDYVEVLQRDAEPNFGISPPGDHVAIMGDGHLEILDAGARRVARRPIDRVELMPLFSDDGEVVITMRAGAATLWWWRSGEILRVDGAAFPMVLNRDELLVKVGGDLARVDLASGARRTWAAPCELRSGDGGGDLLLVRCDSDSRVWDMVADRLVLRVDKALLGFGPTVVRMGRRGDRAFARDGQLVVGVDLTPEDRPAAEIRAAVARLLGAPPRPL